MIKILLLMVAFSQATTLKHMAQTSNALLVLADKPQCGYDSAKISMLSQSLQAEVEGKIMSLTAKDVEIIKSRISTCEKDCTCDIYALALEKKDRADESLNQKAAKVTMPERKKCAQALGSLCQRLKSLQP